VARLPCSLACLKGIGAVVSKGIEPAACGGTARAQRLNGQGKGVRMPAGVNQEIVIAGLGPSDARHLPQGLVDALSRAHQDGVAVYLRTARHPAVGYLDERQIPFTSFDYLYEQADTFEDVYEAIAETILGQAQAGQKLWYLVPGHPLVAEDSVRILIQLAEESGVAVTIYSGISFLEPLFTALHLDPLQDGLKVVDAFDLIGLGRPGHRPDPNAGTLITQVHSRLVAADIKIELMDHYPDHHPISVGVAAGSDREQVVQVPLYEMDRLDIYDHLTTVYVPPCAEGGPSGGGGRGWDRFVEIIRELRGEKGCPWDKRQTHQSLIPFFIEEVYEAIEAIEKGDYQALGEELGDVLLQVVLHSVIAEEAGSFTIDKVITTISDKMVRRHPHVFAGIALDTSEQVLTQWAEIKAQEKQEREAAAGGLSSRPTDVVSAAPEMRVPNLPSLMQAHKLQEEAAEEGFDWPNIAGVWDKLSEEVAELKAEYQKRQGGKIEEELGDLLFTVVNLARFLGVDPSGALRGANYKFARRYSAVRSLAREFGGDLNNMTLEEMEGLWQEIKLSEKE